MSSELATIAAAALIGLWLALFFLGATGSGIIHLLPVAALVLIVRGARRNAPRSDEETTR